MLGLLERVLEEGRVDGALGQPQVTRAGRELGHGNVLPGRVPGQGPGVAQRGGDHVGGLQDGGVVAPGGGQLEDGGRLRRLRAGGHGGAPGGVEARMEGVQGGGAGPPPPVDGLVRVPHGGDPRVGEERGQQTDLGHGGVLELVQEDRRVLGADLGDGLRDLLGDLAGQGDLVAEVEQAVGALVLRQGPHHVQQLEPLAHGGRAPADEGLAAPDTGQVLQEPGQVLQALGGLVGAQEVLAQGVGQQQDRGGVVLQALLGQGRGALTQERLDDLPAARLGDEGGVGVDANE